MPTFEDVHALQVLKEFFYNFLREVAFVQLLDSKGRELLFQLIAKPFEVDSGSLYYDVSWRSLQSEHSV